MKEKALIEALNGCVGDWEGDFDIDVEQEDSYNGHCYFSVIVAHRVLGKDYEFEARVDSNDRCEMAFTEDCWTRLTKATLFAWMWFETVEVRDKCYRKID